MTMFATTLYLLALISTADLRKEFPVLPGDKAIVDDAIARWTGDNQEIVDATIPIVIHFQEKRCVLLRLRAPYMGPDAFLCYDNRDNLLEAQDRAR